MPMEGATVALGITLVTSAAASRLAGSSRAPTLARRVVASGVVTALSILAPRKAKIVTIRNVAAHNEAHPAPLAFRRLRAGPSAWRLAPRAATDQMETGLARHLAIERSSPPVVHFLVKIAVRLMLVATRALHVP